MGEPATPASDLYALAVVLYEAATGSSPYPAAGGSAAALAHLTDDAIPLRELRPEVPVALAEEIHRGLAKAPGARRPDAASMRAAMLVALDDLPAHRDTTALPTVEPSRVDEPAAPRIGGSVVDEPTLVQGAAMPTRRRRRWRGPMVGGLAVAIAAAAGFGLAAAMLDDGDGDVALAAAATVPPTTSIAPTTSTTTAPTTTTSTTTTTTTTTTTVPTTTEAPEPPTELDELIELVEDDPAAVGQRGRVLLDKLDGWEDFDSRQLSRVVDDIERWLDRDRIDPEVGIAFVDALKELADEREDDEDDD